MRMPTKILAAAVVAAAVPFAVPAAAAPISQSLALADAHVGSLDQVQYRRHYRSGRHYRNGHRYRSGWYAYGAAPGYGLRSQPRQWNYGNGGAATAPGSWRGCPGGDRALSDAYPSYMCR